MPNENIGAAGDFFEADFEWSSLHSLEQTTGAPTVAARLGFVLTTTAICVETSDATARGREGRPPRLRWCFQEQELLVQRQSRDPADES